MDKFAKRNRLFLHPLAYLFIRSRTVFVFSNLFIQLHIWMSAVTLWIMMLSGNRKRSKIAKRLYYVATE
ncbi:hypothetical protein D7V78_00600 [Parabacteroides distasonis]|uniref:Uncharacterized protein n=1 Tax=Parabacteroides distasonis TaxID=823 RepID=A0A3L7ZTF8_PARDI|nr:hypothetical protein D7V78_00600 [Parabacteroides distasonis]